MNHSPDTPKIQNRPASGGFLRVAFIAIFILSCLAVATAIVVRLAMSRVRSQIVQACEPGNPAIEAVAAVIRREGKTPLEEVALVSLAADHLLDYDRSLNVYGPGIPTVSAILERRREAHWLYPRGDCKENAVIAGSLLSALGIRWEPETSLPLGHAWVRVHLAAGSWDIMAVPAKNLAWLGSGGLEAYSFLAGGSAVPIRAPDSRNLQPLARLIFSGGIAPSDHPVNDAAALGLVIVTPGGVCNHSPVNFIGLNEPENSETAAWTRSRVAGFPLGEPL
jgi:hypothetical protein